MSGEYPTLLRNRALRMLRLAERLLEENDPDLAVLHAEHAAQLYLKQLLLRVTGEEYRGHSLRALLGALRAALEDLGLRDTAERVTSFTWEKRRLLAELEEGHTRAVYGVYEYT